MKVIYETFKISSQNRQRLKVGLYEKVNQALLKWFTLMHGNNIPINGQFLLLEKAHNLLTHSIAKIFKHQTDGLEDGKRGTFSIV